MSINYLDIIKKAWKITWHNKYLWWFGLFTALTSGGGYSSYNFPGSNKQSTIAQEKVMDFFGQHLPVIIFSVVALLIIVAALSILGIIGRGALIKSINATTKNETSNFKTGLSAGKKYFWKLFVLGLSLGLSVLAILFVILVPIVFLFASQSYVLGTILALAGIMLFIPLIILVSFLKTYGQLYVVLSELSLWPAIENAYALFLKNLGASIIMSLIFMVTGMIFGLTILLALIPVGIIFAILGGIFYLLLKSIGIAIIAGLGIITFIILLLAAKAVYETFAQAVWVLFFHEIAKSKVTETVSEIATEETPAPSAAPDPVIFLDK